MNFFLLFSVIEGLFIFIGIKRYHDFLGFSFLCGLLNAVILLLTFFSSAAGLICMYMLLKIL